jgi:hypothetical protein
MSPIARDSALAFLLLVCLAVALGCGNANPEATFDPESDEGHSSGWLPEAHAAKANEALASCAECHGPAFGGGISESACTSCHLGSETEVHPPDWADLAFVRHEGFVEAQGNASCAVASCHGTDLDGVASSGPSCITACHLGGLESLHPEEWGGFAYARHEFFVAENGTVSCSNSACHGTDLGGAPESGPSCTECHLGGVFSVHPVEWDEDILLHEDFVASRGTGSCRNITCHGSALEGVPGSGPSCFICHSF